MSREYERETREEEISRLADEHARKLNAEIARLRAEVEELRRWKGTHSVTANIRVRAESAEARVAELEAALFTLACSEEMLRGVHPTADPRWEILRYAAERARALLAPRGPKPLSTPKCWHCSYVDDRVYKFCGREDCGEAFKFDIGGTVVIKPDPKPRATCGGSGRVASSCYCRPWLLPKVCDCPGVKTECGGCPDCRPKPCGACGNPAHAAAEALAMDYRCPECRGGEESL